MTSPTAAFPYVPGIRLLHSPGPSNVPKAVLDAMTNQPMDMGDAALNAASISAATRFVMERPKWRLSLQNHKILGIP